jgi:hypothetical protein
MFAKLCVAILGLCLIGATQLALRQRQYEITHDLVETHRKMDETRSRLWTLQAQVAKNVEPGALEKVIAARDLKLSPLISKPR